MAEYISREETVKAFCEKCKGYYDGHCIHRGECEIDVIKNAPAADVQPVKHGRWITWDDSGFTKCSCCNSEYYISDLQVVGDSEGFVDFCPNCGARMRGTSND